MAWQFLRWVAQHDDSALSVKEMTQAVNRQPIDLPSIEEETLVDTEPNFQRQPIFIAECVAPGKKAK